MKQKSLAIIENNDVVNVLFAVIYLPYFLCSKLVRKLRNYFKDFFSIDNGYVILDSNIL